MSTAQARQVTASKREEPLTYKNLSDMVVLNHEEIVKLLPLYKEDCVYMREACLKDGVLHCSFNTFDYPFSKNPTKHFTRTHALLFVTQASYLIGAILSEHNPRWPLDRQTAISLARQEKMTFTDIELRFRKYIRNENGIELRLFNPSFRSLGEKIFAEIEFEFPAGCYGKCKSIIALEGTLNPMV